MAKNKVKENTKTVNFWTLIFGTLSWVVVESLLYNPMHKWGKFWAKESGMAEKMDGQQMTTGDMLFTFGGTIVGGILLSAATYQVV